MKDTLSSVHVIILSNIRWNFLRQRQQVFAEFLSSDYSVTFIESTGLNNPRLSRIGEIVLNNVRGLFKSVLGRNFLIKKKSSSLHVVTPMVLPPTYRLYRSINCHLLIRFLARQVRTGDRTKVVLIAYLPTATSLHLIKAINPDRVLYDCVLNYEYFPGVPQDIKTTEKSILLLADCVISDSSFLIEKHRRFRNDIVHIPAGVDYSYFSQLADDIPIGRSITATYFGGMGYHRFDWEIIKTLAEAGIGIRLIGPLEKRRISHKNIEYTGAVPYKDLVEHITGSSVLILPYKVTDFTKGTFPAKLFECLATGKPIVSVRLPDIEIYSDYVYCADGPEDFCIKVEEAVTYDNKQLQKMRLDLAKRNSWAVRTSKIKDIIDDYINV